MLLKRPKIWCSPARGFVIRRPASIATVISRINGDRIAAVVSASHRAQASDRALDGSLETAGWVDLHAHVFEWMTTFGLPPDDAGSIPGRNAVEQGGAGAHATPAFKHYIADYALTDTRCFPSINSAGTLRGGLAGPIIHTPEVVDGERAGYCGAQDSLMSARGTGVGLVVSSTSIGAKFRYLKLERVSKEPGN